MVPHVLGQRRDREPVVVLEVVGFRHHVAQPGLGEQVVGAVHEEHAAAGERGGAQLRLVAPRPGHQLGRVLGDVTPVGVRAVEVLGAHRGAVGRPPPERGLVDHAGDTPPHHCVLEAGESQHLRHLLDVAEHVGEIADAHGGVTAQRRGASEAVLEVPHDGLARDHELVHEDHPRPHLQPTGLGQRAQAGFGLGSHCEVVVDHRGLPVEEEPGERRIALEQREEVVDQVHELHTIALERRVPLPIPVRVGDDPDRLHRVRICRSSGGDGAQREEGVLGAAVVRDLAVAELPVVMEEHARLAAGRA